MLRFLCRGLPRLSAQPLRRSQLRVRNIGSRNPQLPSRRDECLKADISFCAAQEPRSLSLRDIRSVSTREGAAQLCHAELPIRCAQRIQLIEALEGWDSSQELREVHNLYTMAFKHLRMTELTVDDLDPFTELILKLKRRMQCVIPNIATAMRTLEHEQGLNEACIGEWLEQFLLCRIGTITLTSQYIAFISARGSARKGMRGIVDDACDPVMICERAAEKARMLCRQEFTPEQDVTITVESFDEAMGGNCKIKFPCIPHYLFYIMVEVLKNSARATVEAAMGDPALIRKRPIVISVGTDNNQLGIRVDDLAGGIPDSAVDRIWAWMYSTSSKKGGQTFLQQGTPLAGFGVGLPMSRLYARYLGGTLELQSKHNIGTRANLLLQPVQSIEASL